MEIGLSIIGFGVTFLAGAVTYLAWRNGKITRENTLRIIGEIKEGFKRMDRGFEMMERGFERMEKGFEKMHEDLKFIALLILAETKEEKEKLAKRILGEI